ncbi:MAG: hypothetical protein O7A65_08410 [Proteobacteria bacterium]|nr:hypothetical protein [Pseudomonadota bacterium]
MCRLHSTIPTVEIRYNRWTTTPEMVKQLANEACAKKGGHAMVVRYFKLQCALVAPVSGIFEYH